MGLDGRACVKACPPILARLSAKKAFKLTTEIVLVSCVKRGLWPHLFTPMCWRLVLPVDPLPSMFVIFLYLAHFLGHPSQERRQLLLDVLQKRRQLWGPSARYSPLQEHLPPHLHFLCGFLAHDIPCHPRPRCCHLPWRVPLLCSPPAVFGPMALRCGLAIHWPFPLRSVWVCEHPPFASRCVWSHGCDGPALH